MHCVRYRTRTSHSKAFHTLSSLTKRRENSFCTAPSLKQDADSHPRLLSPSSSSTSSRHTNLVPPRDIKPQMKGNFFNNSIPKREYEDPVISSNKLISYYIRSGDLESGLRVFRNMTARTTITWNSILAGYCKMPGKVQEACQLFDIIPQPNTVSYNTMLSCYLVNSDVQSAREFFNEMPVKDIASWNTMISGFSQNGMMDEARKLFSVMPERNLVTWNAMISGYVEAGDMDSAMELLRVAPVKTVIAWTAVLTGYMRVGKVGLAEDVFSDMPARNLITWNAMISGYVENCEWEKGLKLFKHMVEMNIRPNESSLSSVLLGCSSLCSLELGKQVHQLTFKSPLFLDTTVGTSLISMYCKCGDLEDAWRLFIEMSHKDIVTWNAMISGYAQHGVAKKALQLFARMINERIIPDWITFIGVLSACNHAGLVDLGIWYFDKMQVEYGVRPRPDHYSCMVQLLGRAGKLVEAVDLIRKMPFKPHPAIFGILLNACRIHKNIEMAEYATENLLALDPSNAVAYVQLANVYAERNRWDHVSRVRRLMRSNKVVKSPGSSWIEVEGAVHEFRSGDKLHPELASLQKKLKELENKMKMVGYVPDLE